MIPQGTSFISHLLSLAASNQSLLDTITLDISSRAELWLWQLLLANWNGITFFYDDQLSHSDDIQLYTDAGFSVSLGGCFGGM